MRLLMLMAIVVFSVSTHAHASRASDEVTQADDRYLQMMRQPDRAGLGELLAKEYVFTNRFGFAASRHCSPSLIHTRSCCTAPSLPSNVDVTIAV